MNVQVFVPASVRACKRSSANAQLTLVSQKGPISRILGASAFEFMNKLISNFNLF